MRVHKVETSNGEDLRVFRVSESDQALLQEIDRAVREDPEVGAKFAGNFGRMMSGDMSLLAGFLAAKSAVAMRRTVL